MNIVMGVFSIVISLIVLISVVLYTSREHFTNSIRFGIGAESCNILKPTKTDPKVLNILESGRLRAWKPAQGHTPLKGHKYCYIHDNSHVKDPFMAGKKCSKDDPAFNDIPFIKDVYEDRSRMTTKYSSDGPKCIIDIDPTKITDDALGKWWGKWMGENECGNINKLIFEKNDHLKNEKTKSVEMLKDLVTRHAQNSIDLKKLEEDINKLKALYKGNDLSQKYNETLQEFNALNKTFNEFKEVSEGVMNILRNKRVDVDKEHTSLKAKWSIFNDKYVSLGKEKEKNQKEYAELNIKYNNIMKGFVDLNKQYNTLFNGFQGIRDQKAECDASLNTETDQYVRCKNNLGDRKAIEQKAKELYQQCQVLKRKCETDTTSALANFKIAQVELKNMKKNVENCYAKYNKCMMDFKKIDAEFTVEKAQFASTQVRLPHESCRLFSESSKTNDEYIVKCNNNEQEVKRYEQEVAKVKNTLDSMGKDEQSCEKSIMDMRMYNVAITHLEKCSGNQCNDCSSICDDINGMKGTSLGMLYPLTENPNSPNACVCQYVGSKKHSVISQAHNNELQNTWLTYPINPVANCKNAKCERQGDRVDCQCDDYKATFENLWINGKRSHISSDKGCWVGNLSVDEAQGKILC
jgi:hypothetical protein